MTDAEFNPFAFEGLTYDDVLLLPGPTDVIPSDADTTSRLSKRITVHTPLLSAAFQVVVGGLLVFATGILIGSS